MGFYVDIAEALDAEGIESRVNDGTLFVPVSEDLEVQFVDITGGTGIPGANVFLAMADVSEDCLLYTSPSPRDRTRSRMPSSA